MLKALKFEIRGRTPLLMHNGRLSNPLDDMTKSLKEATSVRKKTDEQINEVAHREFLGSLYVDDAGRPVIPSSVIEAAVTNGAKKNKLGKQFSAGVFCDDDATLLFKGPTTPEKLWADPKFRLVVPARIGQVRVLRCRPMFRKWALTFTLVFDDGVIANAQDVERAVEVAGRLVGIGDWRPKFGRFDIVRVSGVQDAR